MLIGCKIRWLFHLFFFFLIFLLVFCRFNYHYNSVVKPFIYVVDSTCVTSSMKVIKSPLPYQCVEVSVKVTSNVSSAPGLVTLYADEEAFARSSCSFYPGCSANVSTAVNNFIETFGKQGANFSCKHQRNNNQAVVITAPEKSDFFHRRFWPGLLVLIAILGILRVISVSCFQKCCSTRVIVKSNYVPYVVDGRLRCPCQDSFGCKLSCGCLELSSSDFCYYKQGNSFLGIVCKYCWKECLANRFVNFNIQANAPAVKVKHTELRYRPPIEPEFNTCFENAVTKKIVNTKDIPTELSKGDHIMWHRSYGTFHHAIVADIVGCLILVIEWSNVQGCHCVVHEHMVDIEACKFCYGDLYKVTYAKDIVNRNPTELVLGRARSMLGLTGYGFFSRDSESFAKFCKTGINFNQQYPCLICQLSGFDYRECFDMMKEIATFGTFKTVILAGALTFAANPQNVMISIWIIAVLEITAYIIDFLLLLVDHDLPMEAFCASCCCGSLNNEFRKSIWMRTFETSFGVAGMIGGIILAHTLIGCVTSPLGALFRMNLFGVFCAFVFGVIAKYLGSMIGACMVQKLCSRQDHYEELS